MQTSLQVGQTQGVTPSPTYIDASGNVQPGTAVLSLPFYVSSDPTIFTIAADPANVNGAIITGVAAGTATMSAKFTGTEINGVTESLQGVATVTVTAVPPPPPPVSTGIAFAFAPPVFP